MQVWIEGETSPRNYTLKTNGDVQDLTGATVEMLVKDVDGIPQTLAGTITVVDPPGGVVQFSPAPDDLKAIQSPYTILWKVTFLGGGISFFPSTGADYWVVRTVDTPLPFLTFGQMRKQVLRWLDGKESYETGDSLDETVKQQVQEANFQRTTEYPWWFMKAQVPVQLNGDLRVQLPGNMRSLRGIWSPAAENFLSFIPDRMIDVYGKNGSAYTPYTLEGTSIRFIRPPVSETVTIHYMRVPAFMEQPDDISDIPFPHTRILVWDSLMDLKSYTRESEDRSHWAQKQLTCEKALYEAFKEGDIYGGVIPTVKPGTELR